MANIDGLPVNSAVTHAEFISRTENSGTLAKISLQDSDIVSGASVANVQRAINKAFEGVGTTGEADATINDYSSNNYIVDGDNRKVAIEKLDTQLFTTQSDLDTAEAAISVHETRLDTIETLASTFGGDKEFLNNVIVQGNLTVNGTQTILNTATVDSEDPNVTINKNGNDALSEGAGFTVDRTGTKGSLQYQNALASKFKIGDLASEQEIVTVGHTQTLTNKTLTDAEINALVAIEQATTPSTPASGDRKLYSKADGFYQLDSTGLETKVGSGSGSGGVTNLITNGSADDAPASIFTPYLNTAQNRPVTGSGGSPTVTTSLTSANPLSGTKSFLLTKPATNCQGQGWTVLTQPLDFEYRAKSLKIAVSYIVNSGTFVAGNNSNTPLDGDVIWYLRDNTNNKLVEPSNIKMFSSSTTITDKFEATVQFDFDCLNYSLIAHAASTSALAYELKIDNVTVSPQNYVYGTPVTDEDPYIPVFTGFGTVTNVDIFIRKVGDNLEIGGKFTSGTTTATEARMSIPHTVDSIKNASLKLVGKGNESLVSGTRFGGFTLLAEAGVQYLTFGLEASSVSGTTKTNGNDHGSGVVFMFNASVPIQGWSSSVQMSDSADTRVVAARYKTAAAQSIPNSTFAIVDYGTKDFDTHGLVTTGASWKFTASTSGYFRVGTHIRATATLNAVNFAARIYKNGVAAASIADTSTDNSASGRGDLTGSTLVQLVAGDFIDIRVFQNSGGSITLLADADYVYIDIEKINGPQAIAASEKQFAGYRCTTGQSIPNNIATTVLFNLKDEDSHGRYDTATGRLTFNRAGFATINCTIAMTTAPSGMTNYVSIFKNGSVYKVGNQLNSVNYGATLSCSIYGLSGDFFEIKYYQISGSARALDVAPSNNHFDFIMG